MNEKIVASFYGQQRRRAGERHHDEIERRLANPRVPKEPAFNKPDRQPGPRGLLHRSLISSETLRWRYCAHRCLRGNLSTGLSYNSLILVLFIQFYRISDPCGTQASVYREFEAHFSAE